MTLSRLTNYVDGNVLTGAQLNNEFDNILNNGASLVGATVPSISAVQGLTGSLISNIGSFAALSYSLKSTTLACSLSATSSFSVNTQTAGPIANGRDQAAVFASTDVHFYAITTGGTSTAAAGIVSSNAPPLGPTLPAGYVAWAYLASGKYSTASSAISVTGRIAGSRVYARTAVVPAAIPTAVFTAVSIATAVPRISNAVGLLLNNIIGQSSAGGTAQLMEFKVRSLSSSGAPEISQIYAFTGAGVGNVGANLAGILPILETTPTVHYGLAVTDGAAANFELDVLSYSIPNGDVT